MTRLPRWLGLTLLFWTIYATRGACQTCLTNSQVTLIGSLRGANGIPSKNSVLTLTPSQGGFIQNCGINLPTAATCATSTDGSVVGIPNPLTPANLTASGSGTLGIGTYFVVITWTDTVGNQTLPSPEARFQLSSAGALVVHVPPSGFPSNAYSMSVYIGTTSGGETLQGVAVGGATFVQSTALTSGASPPASNTTLCQVVANDAIWPTGTGYKASMVDANGNGIPGFPMQWQLLGPGTTINLANGLPYYHGVVTYPVPILAQPQNHGLQSINGPLSLDGYGLTNVGSINGSGFGIPNPQGCTNQTATGKCLGVAPYTAIGGDYSIALQQAINDLSTAGGGVIYLQCPSTYELNGPLQDTSGANAVITMPRVALDAAPSVGISIVGCTSPLGLLGVSTAGSTFQSNVATGNLFGGFISTGPFGGMVNTELYLYNLTILNSQANPGAVMVNASYFAAFTANNVFISSAAPGTPTNTTSAGILMPVGGNDLRNQLKNVAINGFATPYRLGEHTNFDSLLASNSINCYVFDSKSTQGNGVAGTYLWQQLCTNMIAGGTSPTVLNVNLADSEVATANFCFDPSNMLYGDIWVHVPYNDSRSTSTTLNPAITGCANLRIHNALTGACFGPTCPLSILASNTEAWNSQEGSGTTAYNSASDSSNPLSLTNITWASATGYPGTVANYNGTTSYGTSINVDTWNGSSPRTVCAWVNPTGVPATNATFSIVGNTLGSGTFQGWRLDDFGQGSIGNALLYMINNISGNYIEIRSNSSGILAGQNNLVCFTTDGSRTVGTGLAGTLLYINGLNQPLVTVSNTLTGSVSSGQPTVTGAAAAGGTQFFPGVIARTKVWNRVLSQGEIAALWSAGPTAY